MSGFEAFFDNEKCGELELYDDDKGRMWINRVSSTRQRIGIGLSLLNYAVEVYDKIYAVVNLSRHDEVDGSDMRHLSEEGAALINSAIRNGILKDEWCFNPMDSGRV